MLVGELLAVELLIFSSMKEKQRQRSSFIFHVDKAEKGGGAERARERETTKNRFVLKRKT